MDNFLEGIGQYAYAGCFLLSMINHLIYFIPFPDMIIVFILSATPFGLNNVLLAFSASMGATTGNSLLYYLGYIGNKRVLKKAKRRQMEFARLFIAKHGGWMVLFTAMAPLPDATVFVPLGVIRYSFVKFFIFCLLGKFIVALFFALMGSSVLKGATTYLGDYYGGFQLNVKDALLSLSVLGTVFILIYAILHIDWEKKYYQYLKRREEKRCNPRRKS